MRSGGLSSLVDPCPPPHVLRRLGREHESLDLELERHLERCGACRVLLDRLARGEFTSGATTVAGDEPNDQLGDFPTIPGLTEFRELGRGGEGVVYRARREGLDAWVAVKVPAAAKGSPAGRARDFREARAAASVRHPNVARTFDVGLAGDLPYIVMEYVEGGTLADRLQRDERLRPEAAVRLVADLAEAVATIHRAGLIHRDLKPSNILLHGSPTTPLAECIPLVSDFGLAVEPSAADGVASTPGPGTPGYMAPEQASGAAGTVDARSDVYALGAILFRLLAGRTPHVGPRDEILRRTVEEDAPSVRAFAPGLPRELEAVVGRSLSRSPSRRYASAEDLAAALRGLKLAGWRNRSRRLARLAAIVAVVALAVAARGRSSVPQPSIAEVDEEARSRVIAASQKILTFGRVIEGMSPTTVTPAIIASQEDLELAQKLVARRPGDVPLRLAHARLTMLVGTMMMRAEQIEGALLLLMESADTAEEAARLAPTDPTAMLQTLISLFEVTRALRLVHRYEEGDAFLERALRRIEAASPDVVPPEAPSEFRRQLALNRAARGLPVETLLAEAEQKVQEALARGPETAALRRSAADVAVARRRFDEAVVQRRRMLELGDRLETDELSLAEDLLTAARRSTSPAAQRQALAEAEVLADSASQHADRMDADIRVRWQEVATEVRNERSRGDVRYAFADRLNSATSDAGDVGGGWLVEVRSTIVEEYEAMTIVAKGGSPTVDFAADSVAAFEQGAADLDAGNPVGGRIGLARGMVKAAMVRRQGGDFARALELCNLSGEGLDALADAVGPRGPLAEGRLAALVETWAQIAKALWGDEPKPGLDEAIANNLAYAEAFLHLAPDRREAREGLDRALRQTAGRAAERGDFDTAEAAHLRRRPLNPPGTAQAFRVEDDLRAAAEERRAAHGRRVVAPSR